MRDPEELIPVGKIIDTHGVRGQLKLYSYSGNGDSLAAAEIVTLTSPTGQTREFPLTSFKDAGNRFLIRLGDLDDINQALPLVGSELCLRRKQFPELEADEYYWSDLIGLTVVTTSGISLGKVADIFETGSNDVYVVRGTGREYLIPAIAEVVTSVDLAKATITIEPLDGLLDL